MEVSFVGDVSFTGNFAENLNLKKDIISSELVSFLGESSYAVVNLEGPCTTLPSQRKDVEVLSPPAALDYLKQINVSHVSLANNHIFDCGKIGLKHTVNQASESGLTVLGLTDDIAYGFEIIEGSDLKIGMISICQSYKNMGEDCKASVNIYDEVKFKAFISEVKSKVDWIVVNYHGGEEYTIYPWPSRRRFLHSLLNMGASIIVCHHSHTVQPYEKVGNDKFIFYSLGNFVFDLENHKNKSFLNDSVILKIKFKQKSLSVSFIPVLINPKTGTVIKADKDLGHFYLLNDRQYQRSKWNAECARVFSERNRVSAHTSSASSSFKLLNKIRTVLFNAEFRAVIVGYILNKFSSR
ncbi:CapA family protein [uncultured Shewanella sp.]|uniref:CapA family protein n=1 Tax=uncultured Shewanella sp. TaxID=173975 RepID=UPI00260B9FD0|nr:CapA family protein [uncultured Shewanella sp.]